MNTQKILLRFVIFYVTLSFTALNYCQLNIEWRDVYRAPGAPGARGDYVTMDAQGNVYVAGVSHAPGGPPYVQPDSLMTIKYNSNGVREWIRSYHPVNDSSDTPVGIFTDSQGNVYVAGSAGPFNQRDACLIKYNSAGIQQWIMKYSFSPASMEAAYDATMDIYGNIFICGYTDAAGFIIRVNQSGVVTADAVTAHVIYALTSDNSGNIYAAGSQLLPLANYYTGKFTNNLSNIWYRAYDNGWGGNEAIKIALDDSGNVIVTGSSTGNGIDIATIKYNSSGVQMWVARFDLTTVWEHVNDLGLDGNGNIYVLGHINTVSNFLLIKYNPSGVREWFDTARGYPATMTIDSHDNIYISGTSSTGVNMYGKTLKYNPSGRIWSTLTGQDYCYAMITDAQDNIYVAGLHRDGNYFDCLTIKYSQAMSSVSGFVRYQDNNDPVTSGYVRAIRYDSVSYGIVAVDSAQIQPNGSYTLPNCPPITLDIMAYENDEEELSFVPTYYVSTISWQNATHVKPDSNLANINIAVKRIVNPGASYHISGYIYSNSQTDYVALKDAIVYSRSAGIFKSHSISLSNGYYKIDSLPSGVYELIADRMGYDGQSYVVSLTNSSLENINFYLDNVLLPVNDPGASIPENYSLEQNYPNPFNPVTKIRFSVPSSETSNIELFIYDILGRQIAKLVDSQLKPGTYEVEWNAADYPSGVYFYSMEANGFKDTKKMVLLK